MHPSRRLSSEIGNIRKIRAQSVVAVNDFRIDESTLHEEIYNMNAETKIDNQDKYIAQTGTKCRNLFYDVRITVIIKRDLKHNNEP